MNRENRIFRACFWIFLAGVALAIATADSGPGYAARAWLAGATHSEPVTLECSVDDTLVFVAFGVTDWNNDGGTVTADTNEGRMVRRMQENETCREAVK